MRRLPPLTAIEAFVQVARLGSVKAAAEELALSAPALSRRVQALERFIGKPLFDAAPPGDGAERRRRTAARADRAGARSAVRRGRGDDQRHRGAAAAARACCRCSRRSGCSRGWASCARRIPNCISTSIPPAHGIARLGDGLDAVIALAREIDPALYARAARPQLGLCDRRADAGRGAGSGRPARADRRADRAGPPRHARHLHRMAARGGAAPSSSRWRSTISIRAR